VTLIFVFVKKILFGKYPVFIIREIY